ncbi:MAG: chemotaxis protein CheA [Alphaproteobacteria bacterium]|nr:chemotaxis protein CheA [Alphaproteobacteria bacterium]
MSDLDDFKATYFDECSELLGELEEQFTAIEAGERDSDRLNAVFRAIHSIKGGAGAFNFKDLVGFAHEFETLLDYVRNGKVDLTDDVVALCIRSNDIVADFVAAARNGEALDADYGAEEKARFIALSKGDTDGDQGGEPMEEFDIDFTPVAVDLDHKGEPEAAAGESWLLRFTPHSELYSRANDPLLLLRELAELGDITVVANLNDLPGLVEFEPFGVYCSWDVQIVSDSVTEEKIREVFEFVEGDCDLEISRGTLDVAHEDEGFDFDGPSLADLVAEVKPDAVAPPKTLSVVKPAMMAAPAPGEPGEHENGGARHVGVQSIRVDLDKVDRVVNMVGELVITQSMLTQQMDENLRQKYQELVRGLEVLAQTTRGLQDSVMAIRAQPVKSVFSRMPRLVRELAGKTNKKIKLETVGENTEIDKTVIEQLSDPLTHMIRNSADHGIEKPEKRIAAGKPETGTIRLSAEQAGGNILIIVEDDGAGINRERVVQIARERGVIGEDQQLTDEQIDNLIFAPGFSTVTEVSDISGRGVGMDVVLSNIKKIGGSVHVRSWTGKGTRMTLRLPLTLAVLDVMLVAVGVCPYVIPLSSIVETMQTARADFGRMPTGNRVLQVRGEYVQVIDLAAQFGLPNDTPENQRFVVLCEAEGTQKVALVVDEIIGQQQVVIKSLEENFERIEGIAGGTILGDGSVALIVDVQGLRVHTTQRSAA